MFSWEFYTLELLAFLNAARDGTQTGLNDDRRHGRGGVLTELSSAAMGFVRAGDAGRVARALSGEAARALTAFWATACVDWPRVRAATEGTRLPYWAPYLRYDWARGEWFAVPRETASVDDGRQEKIGLHRLVELPAIPAPTLSTVRMPTADVIQAAVRDAVRPTLASLVITPVDRQHEGAPAADGDGDVGEAEPDNAGVRACSAPPASNVSTPSRVRRRDEYEDLDAPAEPDRSVRPRRGEPVARAESVGASAPSSHASGDDLLRAISV